MKYWVEAVFLQKKKKKKKMLVAKYMDGVCIQINSPGQNITGS